MKANKGLQSIAWVAGLTVIFGWSTFAAATIIWDYSPLTTGGSGVTSLGSLSTGQNVVEQIIFPTGAQVTDMDIYSDPQFGSLGDGVTIRIFNDAGGQPGSLFTTFTESISIIDLIGATTGNNRKHVNFTTPVNLVSNTVYWIGMSGTLFQIAQMGLSTNSPADGAMWQMLGATPFSNCFSCGDMAFRLSGTVIPEPSTLLLLGFGLVGLGFMRRRRRIVRTFSVGSLVAMVLLLVRAPIVNAVSLDFNFSGTINSAIAGTSIVSGDPFSASFRLDTEASQFVAGAFTLSNTAITDVTASIDSTGTFSSANTRTLNGSGDLSLQLNFLSTDPPFNGTGNFGRLSFNYSDVIQNDDLGTLTLAALLGANLFGTVEAQSVASSSLSFTIASVSPIPEPSTMLLLGVGLVGLCFVRRRAT